MRQRSIFLIVFFLVLAMFTLLYSVNSHALSVTSDCTKIETVFARGSGQKLNEGEVRRFFGSIHDRIKDTTALPINIYELGTESYGGYQYPAVAVNNNAMFSNAIGAVVSGGSAFEYGNSVKQGVGELKSYLSQRYAKCKSTGTKYVLGGYSQGAQVVGQALADIPREIRDQIVFTGLFGDPKLHYPEGEGWNPPACQGKNYSPWRRAASNCDLDSGSLGARKPYLPDDMKNKTGLWCYAHDYICDAGAFPDASGHETYKNQNLAIDQAALEAANELAKTLSADIAATIDTNKPEGFGTTGNDTAFVIDTTGSMGVTLDLTKIFVRNSSDRIKRQNGRVALVGYKDVGDVYTAQVFASFTDSYDVFTSQLDSLTPLGGNDIPEAALHGLMTAMDDLPWQNGASKAIILSTDAGYHDPDTVDGSTLSDVVKRSLEIDPVNIYPITPSHTVSTYRQLADMTGGQVITDTGDIAPALTTALTKIQSRPVPALKNTGYKARPNQEITFDASDSYVLNAAITTYAWDFNGDGIFDETTTSPIVNHTYTADFTGVMQVRVSASNDTLASASAAVTITHETAPAMPDAPKNLTATVTSTSGSKSTVRVSWTTDTTVDGWAAQLNDTPLGTLTKSQTSFDITDVDRTSDVTIGIAGTNAAGTGAFSTVNVSALPPAPTPTLSTCSQSNFFVRLLCQAIALAKYVIQGVTYYILARPL